MLRFDNGGVFFSVIRMSSEEEIACLFKSDFSVGFSDDVIVTSTELHEIIDFIEKRKSQDEREAYANEVSPL